MGGATLRYYHTICKAINFNPRSPWGERHNRILEIYRICDISIHAPRGGSDYRNAFHSERHSNFNPRSPWGERPHGRQIPARAAYFNPRSPWGERLDTVGLVTGVTISIHAPRGGSDPCGSVCQRWGSNFNPRSPWGERPRKGQKSKQIEGFQSTLPVGGATRRLLHIGR